LIKFRNALNLGGNGLLGDIPTLWRNLVELRNLDMSVSNLTESVALLERVQLLQALNVSCNIFSGPVPEYVLNFLDPAGNSFNGNSGLCISFHGSNSFCKRSNGLKPSGG
jgi:hypothetical protein